MSLDDIRSLIMAENATLLDTTLQKLESGIDVRLAGQEALLMKEISVLDCGDKVIAPGKRTGVSDQGGSVRLDSSS